MSMTPFERWSVWLTTAGTLITGLAYWWMKDLMAPADPWSVINHPLQPWMLKAHILIAPLMVFSVGLITSRHIWRHFRMRVEKGRRSGLVAAASFIVLVLSGYLLQVVTAETLLRALGWTHLGLGVLYSVGLAAHWPATRQRSNGQHRTRDGGALREADPVGDGEDEERPRSITSAASRRAPRRGVPGPRPAPVERPAPRRTGSSSSR